MATFSIVQLSFCRGILSIGLRTTIDALPLCSFAQTLAIFWIKEWSFAVHSCTFAFSQGHIVATWDSSMNHSSVVPEGDSAGCPFPSHCEVVGL